MDKMEMITKMFSNKETLDTRLEHINILDLLILNGTNKDSDYLLSLKELKNNIMCCNDNKLDKHLKVVQGLDNEN